MMCLLFDGPVVMTIEDATCMCAEDGALIHAVLSEYHTMSCRTGAVPCFHPHFYSIYTEMHGLLVFMEVLMYCHTWFI